MDRDLSGKVKFLTPIPQFIGSYSLVYRAILGDKIVVAAKIIRVIGSHSTMLRKINREKSVWEALIHPNILPFYGHASGDDFEPFGAFISPWCSNGDSAQYLARHGESLQMSERIELWKGVVNGVAFLHGFNPLIIHGDLKPGNILIDDNGNPRICDFGLAHIIREGGAGGMTTTSEYAGTERYLAPEFLMDNIVLPTTASDVYSMALVGLVFVYLTIPYSHLVNNIRGCIIVEIRNGVPPATRSPDAPLDLLWNLLLLCWNRVPHSRPSAAEVLGYLCPAELPLDCPSPESSTSDELTQGYPSTPESGELAQLGPEESNKFLATSNSSDEPDAKLKDAKSNAICMGKVLQPYSASFDNPEEMSVHTGELLWILEKTPQYWRAMKADGTSGLVPSMYLSTISPQQERELSRIVEQNIRGLGENPEGTAMEGGLILCQKRASSDYDAPPDDPSQLSFKKGDIFDILNDSGKWWNARRVDGISGSVPSYYLTDI